MKLTTWNVNGLRARLTHVVDFLREQAPDVRCLQETKVADEQFQSRGELNVLAHPMLEIFARA